MNNLVVITYKRPATDVDKKLYGTDAEYFWDSEAFHDDALANFFVDKAKSRYDDVNVFKCGFADYMNFVDNASAYAHFEQTGEHNLQIIEEDVEVGTEAQTESIQLSLEMSRESETNSFDYTVDVDDVGQIVLTPKDEGTSFVSIQRLAGYDPVEDVVEGNTRKFALSLDANMLAEDDNFAWFVDIDEVGQAVITPDAEDTSFLTVSVNDSLNLITEEVDSIEVETESFDIGDRVVATYNGTSKTGIISDYVSEDPMDGATGTNSGSFEAWIVKFDDGTEGLYGTQWLHAAEELDEDVNGEADVQDIVDRVLRGEIPLYSQDGGEPDPSFIHLEQLDNQDNVYLCRYYYDPESNSAISYLTRTSSFTESAKKLTEEEEVLPQWKVKFETQDGTVEEIFEAEDIDAAVKMAEQHARMRTLKGENPESWKDAEIKSAVSISS